MIEFTPAGHSLPTTTSMPSSPRSPAATPASASTTGACSIRRRCRRCRRALEQFDRGVQAIGAVAARRGGRRVAADADAGVAPHVRGSATNWLRILERARRGDWRRATNWKPRWRRCFGAIDRYRASVTSMAELADQSRAGPTLASRARSRRAARKAQTVRDAGARGGGSWPTDAALPRSAPACRRGRRRDHGRDRQAWWRPSRT